MSDNEKAASTDGLSCPAYTPEELAEVREFIQRFAQRREPPQRRYTRCPRCGRWDLQLIRANVDWDFPKHSIPKGRSSLEWSERCRGCSWEERIPSQEENKEKQEP